MSAVCDNNVGVRVGGNRRGSNGKYDGTVAPLTTVHGDVDQNDPATDSDPKNDDLRKWLTGKEESLLSWLSDESSDEKPEEDSFIEVEEVISEDAEELKSKAEQYEKELSELKSTILQQLQKQGEPIDLASSDLVGKLQTLFDHNVTLRIEVARLIKLNEEIKKEYDDAVSTMPTDQAGLLQRQLELKERESLLESKEHRLSNRILEGDAGIQEGNGEHLEEKFQAELRDKESEFREKDKDYRAKVEYLAEELKRKSLELKQKEEELALARMSAKDGSQELDQKLHEIQTKEKSMLFMEEELARLKIEVRERDDELKKIKEVVGYKEKELLRREEDLDYREKLLTGEKDKVDEAKREAAVGIEEVQLKKRIEALKEEVSHKEEELIAKEKFLNSKAEELRMREQGIIGDEIQQKEEERALEFTVAKVKTGSARLDDLLLGGIPFGSNVLVHGPPFIGKEIMIGQFVGDGLKKGVPCIMVITDKTPKDIRDEMRNIVSGYEEYEKLGLVHYIDTYSRAMGEVTNDPYTTYIDEPTDHDKIMQATEHVANEYKSKYKYYRLAFRSLSTLIAYSDPNTAFRFLSPFCGRRKRDGAVSMYSIEKGVHGEQEIQMLGSIMDGMIDFKLDQLKSLFSVQGICDVQSRSYIRYTVGKHGLNIGSFSLDHIR
jgi:KaiC/GvpD/RAD55 family RecA-like ATPase